MLTHPASDSFPAVGSAYCAQSKFQEFNIVFNLLTLTQSRRVNQHQLFVKSLEVRVNRVARGSSNFRNNATPVAQQGVQQRRFSYVWSSYYGDNITAHIFCSVYTVLNETS
jgi:hypothetical protein